MICDECSEDRPLLLLLFEFMSLLLAIELAFVVAIWKQILNLERSQIAYSHGLVCFALVQLCRFVCSPV